MIPALARLLCFISDAVYIFDHVTCLYCCRTNYSEPAIEVKKNFQAIKILVLGDKGVGKTSLILKYAKNDFDIHNRPTVSYLYH